MLAWEVSGRLVTRSVEFGDSLLGLSRQYRLPELEYRPGKPSGGR